MMSMCGNLKNNLPEPHFLHKPDFLFPNNFGDSAIVNFPCQNSFLDASTFYHLHNILDVNLSLHSTEGTYFIKYALNISFVIFGNVEGQHYFFSSSSLYDSSDQEDVSEVFFFFLSWLSLSLYSFI